MGGDRNLWTPGYGLLCKSNSDMYALKWRNLKDVPSIVHLCAVGVNCPLGPDANLVRHSGVVANWDRGRGRARGFDR